MFWLLLAFQLTHAQEKVAPSLDVSGQIADTRAGISDDERRQREALSHLFLINKKVKDIAQKQAELNQRLLRQEGFVRALAQDVQRLELKRDEQKDMLNKRLRQLYQERDGGGFHWLFSAQSPIELERNHRFLRRMVDNDHHQLKSYLQSLNELKRKRAELKVMVLHYAQMQKQVAEQEGQLSEQMHEKATLLATIKASKDRKLNTLKGLHEKQGDAETNYAFFERKGSLRAPVDVPYTREYGTYVDPKFRFRLTHKGLFYTAHHAEVRAIYRGRVVFAHTLPGYGRAVIVDHGDNYYSVYAFAEKLKVSEGDTVAEGDVLAVTGAVSPLFGLGLYFEIRHFTDAIDPRPWIKESLIKTAASGDIE